MRERESADIGELLVKKIHRIQGEGRKATIAGLSKLVREPQAVVLAALRRRTDVDVLVVGRMGDHEALIRERTGGQHDG